MTRLRGLQSRTFRINGTQEFREATVCYRTKKSENDKHLVFLEIGETTLIILRKKWDCAVFFTPKWHCSSPVQMSTALQLRSSPWELFVLRNVVWLSTKASRMIPWLTGDIAMSSNTRPALEMTVSPLLCPYRGNPLPPATLYLLRHLLLLLLPLESAPCTHVATCIPIMLIRARLWLWKGVAGWQEDKRGARGAV